MPPADFARYSYRAGMQRFAAGLVLAACAEPITIPPLFDVPAMEVELTANAAGTTAIVGCYRTGFVCENGGAPVVTFGSDAIPLEFAPVATTSAGQVGHFEATINGVTHKVPINIAFGGLHATTALPRAFDL